MSRILIVEDEQHLADGLRYNFEAEQYDVDVVDSGEEALARLTGNGPACDLVILDPFNPRSLAFQLAALKDHLSALPTLVADGMLEEPARLLARLSSEVETEDAAHLDARKALVFEQRLLQLSDAIAVRYFLQDANAVPTKKLTGLA